MLAIQLDKFSHYEDITTVTRSPLNSFSRVWRELASCSFLPGEIFSRASSVIFNRAPKVTHYSEHVRTSHPTNCQQ